MSDRDLLKMALEALEGVLCDPEGKCCIDGSDADRAIVDATITALRAALAEPVQEPVAWMVYTQDGQSAFVTDNPTDIGEDQRALPLYTNPSTRRPLTPAQEAAPELHAENERLHAEIERLQALLDTAGLTRAQAEHNALREERDQARARADSLQKLLTAIHCCTYPPVMKMVDGRSILFRPGNPHEYMQALSDRIRALPDEIAAIDAEREAK